MIYKKQILKNLNKCYALSLITVNGLQHLLVAAEKNDPCYLFDLTGNCIETIWDDPGGVMTMVPVPETDGVFLSTQKFYSPNDSADAKLVCAKRDKRGWNVTNIASLPFVHRFDIIPSGGVNYVIACTLKSDHEFKEDWRFPGKIWVGNLGEDPADPLELSVLMEGLDHNHGYTRYIENGMYYGIVSCDQGVFRVTPPVTPGSEWSVKSILNNPASDALVIDIDQDGIPEIFTISPFHGDNVTIWHMDNAGKYQRVYTYPEKLPFLHAICGGDIYGRPTVYIGNRKGDQLLLGFCYSKEKQEYIYEVVDRGRGAANCMLFSREGHPALLAANRETDEIAIYDILE